MRIALEPGKVFSGDFLPSIEGPVLSFCLSGPLLAIQLNRLSKEEVNAFKTSLDFQFGLFISEGILFFLVEIPALLDWSDAPYFLGTVSKEMQPQFPLDDGAVLLKLTIVLIEGTNREIFAVREFSLPEEFSRTLVESIENQRNLPQNAGEALRNITRIQRSMRPAEMLKQAQVRFPQSH